MVHCVVSAEVAVTVMRVLLFVCNMRVLRECEGDVNAAVWEGVVVVSARCEYVGDKRCTCFCV